MHELSICQSILTIVQDVLARNETAGRVTVIRLKVGELSCLEPRTLTSCFEIVAENSPAQGAELKILRVPARWKCGECEKEFERKVPKGCPGCGCQRLEMAAGRELYVENLDVE
jgi:hydrogenase nickel incorporation protein HypA/HybF